MKTIACLLSLLLVVPPAGAGDSARSTWQNLAGLRDGQRVEVLTRNSESFKGAYVRFSEESLTLRIKNNDTAIPRADVRRVRLRKGYKSLWIGLGAGAGAGALVGAAAGARLGNDSGGDFANLKPAITGAMAGVCGLIGLAIGWAVRSHPTTVYEMR